MYVCPCIIYEIDERYPLDATCCIKWVSLVNIVHVCAYLLSVLTQLLEQYTASFYLLYVFAVFSKYLVECKT